MMSIQGSEPAKALQDLEDLSKVSTLTDPQKKVVADLIEQIKKRLGPVSQ